MSETKNSELLDSDPAPSMSKKFGLLWLFGATTILAIVFSFAFDSKVPGSVNPQDPLWKILFGLSAVSIGIISMAGACLVIKERYSNQRWLPHPGYTLFLLLACAYLTTEVSEKVLSLVWSDLVDEQNSRSTLAMGFLYVQGALLLFQAALCWLGIKRDRIWWRIVFVFLALSALGSLFRVTMNSLAAYQVISVNVNSVATVSMAIASLTGVSVVSLLVACVIDFCIKQKRDWIHWCGVIGLLWCYLVPTVLTMIASRFLTVQQMMGVDSI